VTRVRAKCKPENEPSLRILHSLGMHKIGAELTERLGKMHIYETKLDDFLPPDDG
jgi:RimJ/RimL family protein N-acetyltransferase